MEKTLTAEEQEERLCGSCHVEGHLVVGHRHFAPVCAFIFLSSLTTQRQVLLTTAALRQKASLLGQGEEETRRRRRHSDEGMLAEDLQPVASKDVLT